MKLFRVLALAALVLSSAAITHAQEVIMNQPSADVVAKGHVFVRFDSFYTQNPAFYQENLNLAVGLGHNFEISLNNLNAFNRVPVSDSVEPGFKWAPIKTDHFEIFVGDQFVQPLTNKTFSQGNITYEAAAIMTHGWRFTGGSFQSYNAVAPRSRDGAIAGIEYMKSVSKNWMIGPGIDWASGSGTNGYTTPGFNFMYKSFFISPGYLIGNPHNSNGAHQTAIMVGYTF